MLFFKLRLKACDTLIPYLNLTTYLSEANLSMKLLRTETTDQNMNLWMPVLLQTLWSLVSTWWGPDHRRVKSLGCLWGTDYAKEIEEESLTLKVRGIIAWVGVLRLVKKEKLSQAAASISLCFLTWPLLRLLRLCLSYHNGLFPQSMGHSKPLLKLSWQEFDKVTNTQTNPHPVTQEEVSRP